MELLKNITKKKLRGGFYTPSSIAAFILRWAFNGNESMDILEPSCGDGVFLEEVRKGGYSYNCVHAIELDKTEVQKAQLINLDNCTIENGEFHNFANQTEKRFDLIVGNPPYIRYQFFDKVQQLEADKIFKRAHLKYSKLTNAWVSFVIGSCLLLKETGRIGFVLPAEILQVSFARTLRQYLARFFNKISIISFQTLVFPEIQQEVILLLCEKDKTDAHHIEHIEVWDAYSLQSLDINKLRLPQKNINFHSNKWTFYFLDQYEVDFIEEIKKSSIFKSIGKYAKVEVGITTGSNPFFTVPLSTVLDYNLESFARPMVGRSIQVLGTILTYEDWENNSDKNLRAHFLIFPSREALKEYPGALRYLESGEAMGIHTGYKCRIRDEWQIVPSIRVSDALFVRRNNLFPKFLVNKAEVYTTDTMHRVSINPGVNKSAFIASYYNSLSLAFSEISGRSHGGGVLELMPNEVENIVIPYDVRNEELLEEIDKEFRKNSDMKAILKRTDQEILKNNFGLTKKEIDLAQGIWEKLMNRRLQRGKNGVPKVVDDLSLF